MAEPLATTLPVYFVVDESHSVSSHVGELTYRSANMDLVG
jgi:hypothetical protein